MSIKMFIVLFFVLLAIFFMYYIEPKLFKQKLSNNNEHGSARWATKSEIKKKFRKESIDNISRVGFPIYFDKKINNVWFDDITPHWVYLGSSGSGKSSTSVIPLCTFIAHAKEKRSVFITDPKGEIFSKTSKMFKDNGFRIITVDFREPTKSERINLLEPCILEYDKYIIHEKNAEEINKEIETILGRKKIISGEKKYIKENEEIILQIEPNFNKDEYINMLDKKTPSLDIRLKEIKELSFQEENEALFHYAECNRLITSISSIITSDKESKDPFWNNSARNLLEGIIGLFLEDYKDKKITRKMITLSSIKKFQNSSMTEENLQILSKYIEDKPYGAKSKDSLVPILSSAENTYKSITSVFNEKMAMFDDVNVANVTSSSDFDFDVLGKEKTAFYVIITDEDKTYYSLVTMIIGLIYKELVKLANQQEDKALPVPIDFILDEFANCPPLNSDPSIDKMVSVARSRKIRFHLYIQSYSQLFEIYGKDLATSTLDNCGLCYLKTNTDETAQTISRMLGNQTCESHSINYSISMTNVNGSKGTNLISRPLLTPDEIKRLHYKTIIFSTEGYPIFRNTIFYKKLKTYTSGVVERNIKNLKKLDDTYYTVEDLNKKKIVGYTITDNTMDNQKKQLEKLIESLESELESTMNTIEYYTENNVVFAYVGFNTALSLMKIHSITTLIDKEKFIYQIKNNEASEKYGTEIEIIVKGINTN